MYRLSDRRARCSGRAESTPAPLLPTPTKKTVRPSRLLASCSGAGGTIQFGQLVALLDTGRIVQERSMMTSWPS